MRRLVVLVGVTLTALALTLLASAPAQAVKQDQYFHNTVQWINAAKAAGAARRVSLPERVTVAPVVSPEPWAAHAVNSGGPVAQISCKIVYNFYVSKSKPTAVPSDYKTFCALTVHEYGHLVGLQHSSDRKSFMHDPVKVIPPACGALAPTRWENLTPKSK